MNTIDRTTHPYVVRIEKPSDTVKSEIILYDYPNYIDEQGALRIGFVTEGQANAFMRVNGGTFDSKFTHGTTKLVTQDYDVPEGDNS